MGVTKHCKQCGKEFAPKWSKEAVFCSSACRIKWIKRNDQIRIEKKKQIVSNGKPDWKTKVLADGTVEITVDGNANKGEIIIRRDNVSNS